MDTRVWTNYPSATVGTYMPSYPKNSDEIVGLLMISSNQSVVELGFFVGNHELQTKTNITVANGVLSTQWKLKPREL